jgi:hypothetical protein
MQPSKAILSGWMDGPFRCTSDSLESCVKDFRPGVLEKSGRKPRIYGVNKPDLSVLVSSALLLIYELTQTPKTQRTFQIGLKKHFFRFFATIFAKNSLVQRCTHSQKPWRIFLYNLHKYNFFLSF